MIDLFKRLAKEGLESFGRYYGSYEGVVMDIDDPLNMSRLKVAVPEASGEQAIGTWALPKGLWGGKNYGMQLTPEKGDIVWVEFKCGNLKRPIWSHGYFGRGEKPEELNNPQKYWLQTPKGNLVEIDDKNGYIQIKRSNGELIILNDSGISLKHTKIFLGDRDNAAHPASLADKEVEALNDITNWLQGQEADIQTMAGILSALVANSGLGVITNSGSRLSTLPSLANKINEIPSTVVKLN